MGRYKVKLTQGLAVSLYTHHRRPFFESAGRKEPVDTTSLDMWCEQGSSPTQGEGNSSILRGDIQGPVDIVWDGILPGEQEIAKKIILVTTEGWYHTNDIRTVTYFRDMEIWVPKSGRRYSPDIIETIWETG